MDAGQRIYNWILKTLKKQDEGVLSGDVVMQFAISRQTAAHHLRALVQKGLLFRTGSTKQSRYFLAAKRPANVSSLKMVKDLKGLQEDKVFQELSHRLSLKNLMSKNVKYILYYAFTEMLNNSIDHSKSKKCNIQVEVENGFVHFVIRDHGIGAFANVMKYFKLHDETEAAHHLFKGKQTTFSARHSGQGIFFTSRIADKFLISSHGIDATIDNMKEDFLLKGRRQLRGTQVDFWIKARSKKTLDELFKKFANEDFEFDRNQVRLRLVGDELVSRSQARRLLAGLEKFKIIQFDFAKVKGIGQAFADEIFRVFSRMNPKIKLEVINTNQTIQFMIARVDR